MPAEALVHALVAAGVQDERLLRAVRETPRAGFVPPLRAAAADSDVPVAIGHGQVTTQPSLTGVMIDALGLTGGERVLEVGTGLGYQTALLARLAGEVVSIERIPQLAAQARRNLDHAGIRGVDLRTGDGSGGVPDRAPYDAVLVSAAFPEVPSPLVAQLRTGGRLVQPIGPGGYEDVTVFDRAPAGLERRKALTPARFVRLYGAYGYPASPP